MKDLIGKWQHFRRNRLEPAAPSGLHYCTLVVLRAPREGRWGAVTRVGRPSMRPQDWQSAPFMTGGRAMSRGRGRASEREDLYFPGIAVASATSVPDERVGDWHQCPWRHLGR